MSEASALERLLEREHTIALADLAALCALAWLYILTGAGLGMSAWEMSTLSLFPHLEAAGMVPDMPGMGTGGMDMGGTPIAPAPWAFATWALMIAMWWIMMIAMMAPSAAPTILLYARVNRHALAERRDKCAPTGAFAAGYLLVWLGFSVAAAALHWGLERAGLVSAMLMGSQSRSLSSGVLIAAGRYQLWPLKHACLSHCRAPASFLVRHWRPHVSGALRLGARTGAFAWAAAGC